MKGQVALKIGLFMFICVGDGKKEHGHQNSKSIGSSIRVISFSSLALRFAIERLTINFLKK